MAVVKLAMRRCDELTGLVFWPKALRMNEPQDFYRNHLQDLAAQHRLRSLAMAQGVDFSSNDYLGLASGDALRPALERAVADGIPLGSGGSRLLRGNHPEHQALEEYAAAHFGHQAALYFANGYSANSALFATLPQRGDLILHDELIHASTHEGLRLSRADTQSVPHNDVAAFEAAAQDYRSGGGMNGSMGRIWIAVESLYSMDGDIAPLTQIKALADRHDAMLVIDDAHGGGVFGKQGRGLADRLRTDAVKHDDNVLILRTLGKAFGVEGALLGMSAVLCEMVVNRARGFIFSTAPSPFMARMAREAMMLVAARPDIAQALHRRTALAQRIFAAHLGENLAQRSEATPIFPVILGDDASTMQLAKRLQCDGFDVRGIRPPTVPEGTSRLRIVITNNVEEAHILELGEVLDRAIAGRHKMTGTTI